MHTRTHTHMRCAKFDQQPSRGADRVLMAVKTDEYFDTL